MIPPSHLKSKTDIKKNLCYKKIIALCTYITINNITTTDFKHTGTQTYLPILFFCGVDQTKLK